MNDEQSLSPKELRQMCRLMFLTTRDAKRKKDYILLKRSYDLSELVCGNTYVTTKALSHMLPIQAATQSKDKPFLLADTWFKCKDDYVASVLVRRDISPSVLPMYLHWLSTVLIPTNYAWTGGAKPPRKLFVWEIEPLLPLDWERVAYL